MKKILTFLLVLSLCSTSFAQIRERTSQWADNTDFELGAAPFSFRALGYLSFGFSSVLSGDEAVKNHTWTAEYMVDNTITPFSFFYLHNNNGGTYRFSASSYGSYKLIVEGYYQGHFVSRGEKIVTCVGY